MNNKKIKKFHVNFRFRPDGTREKINDDSDEMLDALVEEVSKMERPVSIRRRAIPFPELIEKHRLEEEEEFRLKQEELRLKQEKFEYQTKETFIEAYELMMSQSKAFLCSIYVLEDPELSLQAKIAFFTISSLCFNKGYCFASNNFLAKKLNVSVSTLKRYLVELEKANLIAMDTKMTPSGFKRNIHLQFNAMKDRYIFGLEED